MSRLRTDLEGKSTEELFAASLQGQHDDEAPWEAVHVLRLRGTPEAFEIAKRYCAADDPNARARGLEVLAQLGAGKPDQERPFMGDSVSIAILSPSRYQPHGSIGCSMGIVTPSHR